MRGTLQQEAQEAMRDAQKSAGEHRHTLPSESEKLAAYQTATAAVMGAAQEGRADIEISCQNHMTLRYVGNCLVEQGISVKFDFNKCALVAKWG